MFSEIIEVSVVELDTTNVIEKAIDISQLFPSGLYCKNLSGETINILPVTSSELSLYNADNTVTDLIPILNGEIYEVNNFPDKITTILVSGNGSHSAALEIVVFKDFDTRED